MLAGTGLAMACDNDIEPASTGSIALVIDFTPAGPGTPSEHPETADAFDALPPPNFGIAGFTSVTATAAGPVTRSVSLQLVGAFWHGDITALDPGTYTVTIEAFIDGELDSRGVATGVEVRAGETATANRDRPAGRLQTESQPAARSVGQHVGAGNVQHGHRRRQLPYRVE
ncbi:MAG: hypothetical protein ACE5FJ_04035 [Gemmatimonadales bacterium]